MMKERGDRNNGRDFWNRDKIPKRDYHVPIFLVIAINKWRPSETTPSDRHPAFIILHWIGTDAVSLYFAYLDVEC